jgi:hypothetical protein
VRRAQVRIVATCALAMSALALLAASLSPEPSSPVAVTPPPASFKLTENELLDSFQDQPVALVTWPDDGSNCWPSLIPRLGAASKEWPAFYLAGTWVHCQSSFSFRKESCFAFSFATVRACSFSEGSKRRIAGALGDPAPAKVKNWPRPGP